MEISQKEDSAPQSKVYDMFSIGDFNDLMNILKKANAVTRMDIFNLPQLVDSYYDVNNNETAPVLANALLTAEREEEWRVQRFGQNPAIAVVKENNLISFIDTRDNRIIKLRDTKGYIIIADLQMIFIVPGEESIKSGDFRPNEVIRLCNLLLNTTLFCKLKNIPIKDEDGNVIEGKYYLGFEMNPIKMEGEE